jgi:hypothetical protein
MWPRSSTPRRTRSLKEHGKAEALGAALCRKVRRSGASRPSSTRRPHTRKHNPLAAWVSSSASMIRPPRMLLDAARDWLKEQGMEAMDGPINLGDRNMFWGLLIENFTDPPIYGTNYNPPYYREPAGELRLQGLLQPAVLQAAVEVPRPAHLPPEVQPAEERSGHPHARRVGAAWNRSPSDFCTVYNDAWVDHENHKPMELATALKIVKAMKPVMDPRLLIFIRPQGPPDRHVHQPAGAERDLPARERRPQLDGASSSSSGTSGAVP